MSVVQAVYLVEAQFYHKGNCSYFRSNVIAKNTTSPAVADSKLVQTGQSFFQTCRVWQIVVEDAAVWTMDRTPPRLSYKEPNTKERNVKDKVVLLTVLQSCNVVLNWNAHGLYSTRQREIHNKHGTDKAIRQTDRNWDNSPFQTHTAARATVRQIDRKWDPKGQHSWAQTD